MENLSNFFLGLFEDIGTYDQRKVDSTLVDNLRISTVYSSDCGYETAICDSDKIYPVERYPDLPSAIVGHSQWVARAPGLEEVEELEYLDLRDTRTVKLIRGEKVQ